MHFFTWCCVVTCHIPLVLVACDLHLLAFFTISATSSSCLTNRFHFQHTPLFSTLVNAPFTTAALFFALLLFVTCTVACCHLTQHLWNSFYFPVSLSLVIVKSLFLCRQYLSLMLLKCRAPLYGMAPPSPTQIRECQPGEQEVSFLVQIKLGPVRYHVDELNKKNEI